ncbi:DedA family protein [Propionibacteriaceae bacterium G1746]|uniref:DedA family protein n=1 Tax=Aestuariimicrobium sp. G57 TaxID=3418485 RepID=UPI003C21BBB8
MNPLEWNAPWFIIAAALFVIVMLRANGTYWLGRGLAARTSRSRFAHLLSTPGYQRAARWLERWGAPVVTLSFLTVGVQTLVNLSAGVGRMPLRRYLPAVTVGCVLWALLYSTVGLLTWESFWALHRYSPVLAWSLLAVLAVSLVVLIATRVRKGRAGGIGPGADDDRAVDPVSVPAPAEPSGSLNHR